MMNKKNLTQNYSFILDIALLQAFLYAIKTFLKVVIIL